MRTTGMQRQQLYSGRRLAASMESGEFITNRSRSIHHFSDELEIYKHEITKKHNRQKNKSIKQSNNQSVMKTKMTFSRLFLVLALALTAAVALAQQNQSPTQTVCVGTQEYHVDLNSNPAATYTWALTGGGTIISGSGTNAITVNWTTPGGPFTLSVFTTLDGCSGPPQSVDVTVVSQPVGPTLLAQTPPGPSVCDGTQVSATFNPGSGGVGCSDEFQYRFDGAGLWTTYIAGASLNTTGHTLVEIQGRRSGCATGAGCTETPWVTLATWNVTAVLTVTVEIIASADPVCEGTSVTYTANVTNGGTPTYEWHVNAGPVVGTASTYTYIPVTGDIITCIVVSNAPCASTLPVTGTFTPVVNPKPVTSGIWHN
jgi:hypothetical protein